MIGFGETSYDVNEGAGSAVFTLVLTGSLERKVLVTFMTTSDTATCMGVEYCKLGNFYVTKFSCDNKIFSYASSPYKNILTMKI